MTKKTADVESVESAATTVKERVMNPLVLLMLNLYSCAKSLYYIVQLLMLLDAMVALYLLVKLVRWARTSGKVMRVYQWLRYEEVDSSGWYW